MRLLLCRHGEAACNAPTDAQRPLTERGREALYFHWQQLRQEGVQVNQLIASPYLRAQQTAACIARVYGLADIHTCDSLVPDSTPSLFLEEFITEPLRPGLALISHMPMVSQLTAYWTGAGASRFAFDVGATACLDVDVAAANGARLLWLRNPGSGPGHR